MAALNFPNSPSTNDLHTENGVTFKWNGTIWKKVGSAYTDATNLNVTGISTVGSITGVAATFTGNVQIGGVLTYEDVKNVDSVGVITARSNVYIKNTYPRLYLQDTDTNSDFSIINSNGAFMVYDDTNSANRFTINSNGIGSFNSDLEVAGSHYITDSIIHTGDTNTKIRFPAADTITAETAGNEVLRISSDGKVGIGEVSPDEILHITKNDTTGPTVVLENSANKTYINNWGSNGPSGRQNRFEINATAATSLAFGAPYIAFATNGIGDSNERLRIDSGGRLLIGQTAGYDLYSNGLLQVSSTGGTASISVNRFSNNSSSPYINLGKSRGALGTFTVVQDGDRLGQINFCGADGTDLATTGASIAAYVDGTPGSNDMPGSLRFYATPNDSATETERLRIASNGNVSIAYAGNATNTLQVGNTGHTGYGFAMNSPTYGAVLQVGDGATPTTSAALWVRNLNNGGGTTTCFRVNSNSQVSIGNLTPSRQLDIKEASGNRVVNVRSGGSSGAFLAFLDANTTDDGHVRVGCDGGDNLSLRGDVIKFKNGDGSEYGEITSNSTDNDFKNQNYPSSSAGILLKNWPSSNTTGAFVSSTYTLKAGNGTAQIAAWTAQSTATGTIPDMFYSVRSGDTQQHIIRIGGNDIGRGMELSNNVTLTGARNSNIISERFRVLPSENDGYDDSHILSCAQTAGNWEQGAGTSNADTSWGWLWQYCSANNATRQIRAGIAYDHKGIEEFKYWCSYGSHTWYVDSGTSGDETAETCDKKAMQICPKGSVINTANPTYGIYTHGGVQTSNGGSKNVQYLEDCMGQWIVVAKIQQSSHMQSAMASVAQIDTSTTHNTGTEWSASFGDVYPIAVRYVSSSNWKNWRDHRGVDFIQGVPHGRKWKNFFSNGASSGMTQATGGVGASKYGWTCDGAWDGKGRWHNPTFNWWRMSDPGTGFSADFCNQTFFTSATAANASTALNLNWANDAKFGVHATAATGGQDTEVTSAYGYDDNAYAHEDNYPNSPANHAGSDIGAMNLWICLNVSSVGQFH